MRIVEGDQAVTSERGIRACAAPQIVVVFGVMALLGSEG